MPDKNAIAEWLIIMGKNNCGKPIPQFAVD
jgi:hypothetical protein